MFNCIYCKESTHYIDDLDICHYCYVNVYSKENVGNQ